MAAGGTLAGGQQLEDEIRRARPPQVHVQHCDTAEVRTTSRERRGFSGGLHTAARAPHHLDDGDTYGGRLGVVGIATEQHGLPQGSELPAD